MNSSANLAEQQRQFLEAMATHYGFTGDTRTVFLTRFDEVNANKENSVLARFITWSRQPEDGTQKLQDELKKICQVLEKDECPISKPKRGRQPKGKSPWEQAFKWLWEEKFPQWQQRQNLVGSNPSLSEQAQKNVVCRFLQEIENNFKYDKLLHIPEQPIILKDQYIPIQVTLERKYTHAVETTWGYAESEAELKRAYALKRLEESQPTQVDWKEAKKQHQRIMVLADPGMGKSTLLRREACLTAQEEWQSLENNTKKLEEVVFPLFLRLSDLAETPEEIIDAIPVLIEREYSEKATQVMELLQEKLKVGKCLLLLDALDEVPTEHRQRQRLFEKLNRLAQRQPPCPIICTSRIVGYSGAFVTGVKEVEIVPFSQKQIELYIEKWFDNAEGYLNDDTVSPSSLIQELRNKPQICGLAQNPLLLSLICSLYQEKGLTLPARRCQVYEQAVRYMLGKKSKQRNPQFEGRIIAKTRLLEELAYHFTREGQEIFSTDDLYDQIEKHLQKEIVPTVFRNDDTGKLMAELSEEDGILQKLHKDSDQYLFLHRTFQEYLTACYLKRDRDSIALAREHFWEYELHETLSLLAGLMDNPIPLLKAMTDEKDDIFSTLLLLAGRCIAESQENSHPLIAKIIDRIYELWQSYPNAGFIESVVVVLGQAKPQMLEHLQEALNNSDSYIRWKATEALGKTGNSQAVDALICVLNGSYSDVRRQVTKTDIVCNLDDSDDLICVIDDSDNDVRRQAAEALAKIGNSQAVDALIWTFNGSDSDVRREAAEALAKVGNPQAVDALIHALNHSDSDVRIQAARALGKISNLQVRVVDALIDALNDTELYVRGAAASALGEIGNPQAVPALVCTLENSDSFISDRAIWALGKIGNPQAVDALISALKDSDWYVRGQAARALGEIGNPQTVDALIRVLKDDSNSFVRREAAQALGKIGNPQAVDVLISALNDSDWGVRGKAAEALGKIGNPQAVPALISLLDLILVLNHSDWYVTTPVAMALGEIGNPQAVPALISALNNSDWHLRRMAAWALGKISDSQAVPALILALNDPDGDVRGQVAKTLAQMGNPQGMSTLICALSNPYPYGILRREAAEFLEQIGTSETLAKLIQLPEIDIYEPEIFLLARTLAIRFSKERLSFIPVYPELVAHKQ